jgi:hypothetical protein
MNRSTATLATLTLAAGLASPAFAVTFFDGVFNNADWSVTTTLNTNAAGSSANGLQFLTGGNPNEFRRIRNQLLVSSPTGMLHGFHMNVTAFYDPSNQGAITSIDYSEDSINFVNQNGNGQGSGLAIIQNGRFYRTSSLLVMPFTSFSTWQPNSQLGLTAASFWEVDTSTGMVIAGTPDFSASGSIMQLGFCRANSNNGSINTECGIDNWRVQINQVPAPGAAALLGLGTLSIARRRRSH